MCLYTIQCTYRGLYNEVRLCVYTLYNVHIGAYTMRRGLYNKVEVAMCLYTIHIEAYTMR